MPEALKIFLAFTILFCGEAAKAQTSAPPLISHSAPPKLVETQVHGILGAYSINTNYRKEIPTIQNQNTNPGFVYGIGGKAVLGITDFIGVGVQLNVLHSGYNIDMTVMSNNPIRLSAIFINSSNYTVTAPFFLSLRLNVARKVRWNIDGGLYYSFGFAGNQKQLIYRSEVNSMGEVMAEMERVSTDYYHSPRTAFNVFNRGDLGIFIGTSLDFGKHFNIGIQLPIGLKNAARTNGVISPTVHNYALQALLGYRF